MTDVTRILSQFEHDDSAAQKLLPLVYDELRRLANARLSHEKPGQTLEPTALVHEAFLRLVDREVRQKWDSRRHFFGAAAEAMRRILVENARRKKRLRHGGDRQRLDLETLDLAAPGPSKDLVALSDALDRLADEEPSISQLVKLRYFAGLTIRQASELLGISVRTANRDWAYAKAWLFDEISK